MTASSESYSTIETERIGLVERITLNRPEKHNALSAQLQEELIAAVQAAERSLEARVIIIRGGGRSFSSGYDLGPSSGGAGAGRPTVEGDVAAMIGLGQRWANIWNCRIPVIAQVHGYCLAGGTDLALHCDLIVAAENARIGFPPVRAQGAPPTHMWVYHVGPQWSKRLLLTGDTITGAEAASIGLVLEAVPEEQLDDHALALATRISNIGHDLLAHNKRIVNLGIELMGRSQLQVMAGIHDALAHLAPEAVDFSRLLRDEGVRGAVAARDAKFQE